MLSVEEMPQLSRFPVFPASECLWSRTVQARTKEVTNVPC